MTKLVLHLGMARKLPFWAVPLQMVRSLTQKLQQRLINLPLPSVVRVTNLDNGKSLVVRVNDRGPFAKGRIIDLSHEGARLLGFVEQGIAKVRVQILAEQSLRLERLAKRGEFPSLSGYDQGAMPKWFRQQNRM